VAVLSWKSRGRAFQLSGRDLTCPYRCLQSRLVPINSKYRGVVDHAFISSLFPPQPSCLLADVDQDYPISCGLYYHPRLLHRSHISSRKYSTSLSISLVFASSITEHLTMPVAEESSLMSKPRSYQSRDLEGEQSKTASRVLGNKEIQESMAKTPQLLPNQDKRFAEPVHHSRRPHRKVRTGCANCKRRRIKVRLLTNIATCNTY